MINMQHMITTFRELINLTAGQAGQVNIIGSFLKPIIENPNHFNINATDEQNKTLMTYAIERYTPGENIPLLQHAQPSCTML